MECWKHLFHLGILEKWFQKLNQGGRTQVSVGLGTHPQLFTAIRLETRTKGYVSMLAKNCKKSGDRWDVPSSLHTGRTPESYTPGEGVHSCHLHRVTRVLHGASLGPWADPADPSLAPSPPHQPQNSGNTPLPRERIHFPPVAVLTPVTAWE